MNIKLATFNVGALERDLDANLKILGEQLRSFVPDILFMQEYVPDERTDAVIEKATGLPRAYYKEFSASHVAKSRMGIAVFSRHAVMQEEEYSLVKPDRVFYYDGKPERFHDKFFVRLSAEHCGKRMDFLTGHGFSFNRYGIDPLCFPETICPLDDWLSARAVGRTIAIGDFNLENGRALLPKLSAVMTDLFADVATRPNGRKTDYVMLPPGASCVRTVNSVCGSYTPPWGFDHNYIGAEIEIE